MALILGTKANALPVLAGSIPDTQLVLVPDPTTGELKRTTFGQVKADLVLAIGDLSYLDDIIEKPTIDDLPQPGEVKKIYVITTGPDANKQFRWGGSIYIEFPQGSGDVAAEAIIRGNADTTLQANIDAETTARISADSTLQTNINNEATSRNNADIILQNNISSEANTRSTNDGILQGLINTEGTTRATADNALSARITALEEAGAGGESTTIETTIVPGTTYTLLSSDSNKQVICTSDSPVTITVPAGLPSGFICGIVQEGEGQVTVIDDGTTFISNRQSSFSTAGKDAVLGLQSVGTDQYILSGDTYTEAGGTAWGSISGTLSDQTDLQAALDAKLDASSYNDHFKGKYTSLSALTTAHPTANAGDYAQVDAGSGSDVINYNYDEEDGWIEGGIGSAATTTDELPDGSTNLYFTDARARDAVASVGYLTSASSLAWAKITGAPTTLAGYGIADAYPLTGNPSGFITGVTPTTGGTGQTSWAAGDLLYASAVNTLSKLAAGTDGYVLTMVSGLPAWAAASEGGGSYVKLDGTTALTGDWNIGNHAITIGSDSHTTTNPYGLRLYASVDASSTNTVINAPSLIFRSKVYSGGVSVNNDWSINAGQTFVIAVNGTNIISVANNGDTTFKNGLIFNGSSPGLFSSSSMTLQTNGGLINLYNGANSVSGGVRISTASGILGNSANYTFLNITNQWAVTSGAYDGRGIYFDGVIRCINTASGNFYGILYNTNTLAETFNGRHIAYQNNYGDVQLNTLGGSTQIGSASVIPASAIFSIVSTTKGVLLPRMTTTQRDAISTPAEGLEIYNTTTHKKNVYTGSAWEQVTSA